MPEWYSSILSNHSYFPNELKFNQSFKISKPYLADNSIYYQSMNEIC